MNGVLTLQYKPVINNPDKNFETVLNSVSKYNDKPLDLILFPEFFSTGISHAGFLKYGGYEKSHPAVIFAQNLAKKYNTNICAGSVIEKEGENLYNTSYLIDRSGKIIGKYRKIHLYSYFGGTEHEVLTPGDKAETFELDFACVGIGICFDLRFPRHFNKLAKMGAEILLCPNAWCLPLNSIEKQIMLKKEEIKAFSVARSCENLAYFIGSSFENKIGSGLVSCAKSLIVSPYGEILSTDYAEIDLELLRNLRKEFPVHLIS